MALALLKLSLAVSMVLKLVPLNKIFKKKEEEKNELLVILTAEL